jgi:hypothetical protein
MRRNSTKAPGKGPVSLPRLPVPDLSKTLSRYLASLEPLLLEDEKRGGISYQSAYSLREKWAQDFEFGIGQLLQDRLLGPLSALFHLRFEEILIVTKHSIEHPRTIGWTITSGLTKPTMNGELLFSSTPIGGLHFMTTI